MDYAAASQWVEATPVFLLEISWGARIYRFSTEPITLTGASNSYLFHGGMDAPEIGFTLEKYGFSAEGESIPIAVTFPVNVSEEQERGNLLDGARAEISFILQKNGVSQQAYEERFIQFSGLVSQPVFGSPDAPVGYVEFSIEQRAIVESTSLLEAVCGPNGQISDNDILNGSKKNSVWELLIAAVDQVHKGKKAPIVLGETGKALGTISGNLIDVRATPAYVIAYSNSVPDNLPLFLLIAGHPVTASSVKIYDSEGNSDTATPAYFVGPENNVFTYVIIEFASTSLKSAVIDNQIEYWCAWTSGGGLPSPYRSGPLEGGGDVCLWALSMVSKDVDFDRWIGLAPVLNRYKFAGYINEAEIDPIGFLEQNIFPFLPISVGIGPKGFRPILNLAMIGEMITPQASISAGPDFFRVGSIITESSYDDIANQIQLNFAFNSARESYYSTVRIVPDKKRGLWFEFTDDYASVSYQIFGRRSKSFDADYIYDYQTAILVIQDLIRDQALPKRLVEYSAAPAWGWLQLGDIISLSDSDLSLVNRKTQILEKKWSGSNWIFKLEIEQNPVIN